MCESNIISLVVAICFVVHCYVIVAIFIICCLYVIVELSTVIAYIVVAYRISLNEIHQCHVLLFLIK